MADTPLVSTDWLAEHLESPDIAIIDASWYMPADARDTYSEYLAEHIPGAVHFDIDTIADPNSDLPHMLPSPIAYSSAMRKLGIGDGQRIVVYDTHGLFAAPRVWWTFKVMGVDDVSVLEGGLPKWKAEGRPVEDGPVRRPERHFTARLDHAIVADLDDVRRALKSGSAQVVDARSAGRFDGSAPEPRPGLKSGHMPGSSNLPFQELMDGNRLVAPEAVRAAFEKAGVALDRPIVTTCGSGVSAAILALGLATAGHGKASVYDGSWTEWAGRDDTEIETG